MNFNEPFFLPFFFPSVLLGVAAGGTGEVGVGEAARVLNLLDLDSSVTKQIESVKTQNYKELGKDNIS